MQYTPYDNPTLAWGTTSMAAIHWLQYVAAIFYKNDVVMLVKCQRHFPRVTDIFRNPEFDIEGFSPLGLLFSL